MYLLIVNDEPRALRDMTSKIISETLLPVALSAARISGGISTSFQAVLESVRVTSLKYLSPDL